MKIDLAIQIAKREWKNIAISLDKCGDIGEFFSRNQETGKKDYRIVSQGLLLVRNLVWMENKLPTCGYTTREASYVFSALASKAAKRLGLEYGLAQNFGSAYSWTRTGWFSPSCVGKQSEHQVIKQLFFYRLFFPFKMDCADWDYKSPAVKTKLKLIFSMFENWQSDHSSYSRDLAEYQTELCALWKGLALSLGLPQEFPENLESRLHGLREIQRKDGL